jgi:hypothetical protein
MTTTTIITYDHAGNEIERRQAEVPPEAANADTIVQQTDQALVSLRGYVALSSPTAAQTTAVVKVLCKVAIGLVRMQLRRFDATD